MLSEKSTVHIADGKNLQNSSKIQFHHFPFFPSPPHFTPSPPPSCSLFQKRQPPPRQGAATHRRGASHPQLGASLPLASLSLSSSHKTQFTPTHPLTLASGSRSMQNARNKARGWWGWSAMTVPQHNLFYLTPANAPEQTGGHSGAQRTHAAPCFNNRPNQRRQKTVLHQDARMHLVLFTTLVQSSWHHVILQIEYSTVLKT